MCVPTPIKPPGTAYLRSFASANKVMIFERIGSHLNELPVFVTIPGRTTISSPTLIKE